MCCICLCREVVAARKLTVTETPVDYELIRKAQPQHVRKRTQALARATAANLLGVPTTQLPAGLNAASCAVSREGRSLLATYTDLAVAFGGAARRLLGGKNCESLELWREGADDMEETDDVNHAAVHAAGAAAVCAHLTAWGLGLSSLGLVVMSRRGTGAH